jgi:hypothetical protein
MERCVNLMKHVLLFLKWKHIKLSNNLPKSNIRWSQCNLVTKSFNMMIINNNKNIEWHCTNDIYFITHWFCICKSICQYLLLTIVWETYWATVGMGLHFFLGPVLFASASALVRLQGVSLCVSIMQVLQPQHNHPSC